MGARPSKFQGLFEVGEEPEPEPEPVAPAPARRRAATRSPAAPTSAGAEGGSPPIARHAAGGEPAPGKRSDPRYRQITAYVRRDLYRRVTEALHDEVRGSDAKRKEISELVDKLLERWCQQRPGRPG